MNGRRRLIGSFNHGSMANALPQAIGAQASQPGRQIVALSLTEGTLLRAGARRRSAPITYSAWTPDGARCPFDDHLNRDDLVVSLPQFHPLVIPGARR